MKNAWIMKIGFLLNHYDLHQIPHIVPYALELARRYPSIEVVILSSSTAQTRYAKSIAAHFPASDCRYESLDIPWLLNAIDPLLSKWFFMRKEAALRFNLHRLGQFDALVTPEMTALSLKRSPALANTKLIFTGHGAGDNPRFGSLDARISQFDFCLLPGAKYADALAGGGLLRNDQYAIAGYPKFAAVAPIARATAKLFNNDRPTVVYNPHHRQAASSWRTMGLEVLDYFYASDSFNLIFAPHVVLFKRAWGRGARLPRRYQSNAHVLIDTGSMRSVDMSYLDAADVYLGDVSSQVYEFLVKPRPCVFLDARDAGKVADDEILSWRFGTVINDVKQLDQALHKALKTHDDYIEEQRRGVAYTFADDHQLAAARGADAIVSFMRPDTFGRAGDKAIAG